MGKNKRQGTAWETRVCNLLGAHRLPEGGRYDIGDVCLGEPPGPTTRVAVAWKRYRGDGPRRRATETITLSIEDFYDLWEGSVADRLADSWVIECKATERLDVVATLQKAQAKLDRYLERKES